MVDTLKTIEVTQRSKSVNVKFFKAITNAKLGIELFN